MQALHGAASAKLKSILLFVGTRGTPSILPVLRCQEQAHVLALLLGNPARELSLTQIADQIGAPQPAVDREVQRAEQAGLLITREAGNIRLFRANTASPYYTGLADVLTKAFPAVLREVLSPVHGISEAYIYGSWAARCEGHEDERCSGCIDLLILGDPDRDQLYQVLGAAEMRLGRSVQAQVRDAGWLASGAGAFHYEVTSQPLLSLCLSSR